MTRTPFQKSQVIDRKKFWPKKSIQLPITQVMENNRVSTDDIYNSAVSTEKKHHNIFYDKPPPKKKLNLLIICNKGTTCITQVNFTNCNVRQTS
jgi:hypothetical protein